MLQTLHARPLNSVSPDSQTTTDPGRRDCPPTGPRKITTFNQMVGVTSNRATGAQRWKQTGVLLRLRSASKGMKEYRHRAENTRAPDMPHPVRAGEKCTTATYGVVRFTLATLASSRLYATETATHPRGNRADKRLAADLYTV